MITIVVMYRKRKICMMILMAETIDIHRISTEVTIEQSHIKTMTDMATSTTETTEILTR